MKCNDIVAVRDGFGIKFGRVSGITDGTSIEVTAPGMADFTIRLDDGVKCYAHVLVFEWSDKRLTIVPGNFSRSSEWRDDGYPFVNSETYRAAAAWADAYLQPDKRLGVDCDPFRKRTP